MITKFLTGLCALAIPSLLHKSKEVHAFDISKYNPFSKGATPPPQTFAQQNPELKNTSIMVIGETGVGKSTLVNMIASYLTKSTVEKPYIVIPNKFHPIPSDKKYTNSEDDVQNRKKAQTQKATTYSFPHNGGVFSIVDTPGMNDPEGNQKDEKNLEIIIEAAEKANSLSAIVLVLNGTEARITPNIQSILTRLQGSIPDSITNNIVIVFTMCREETCNQTDIKALGFDPEEILYFNNTAFSSPPEKRSQMTVIEWDESMKSCENLIKVAEMIAPISTNEFTQIKTIRSQIKSLLQDGRNKLSFLQQLNEEYEKSLSLKEKADTDVKNNSNYTTTKTINKAELVPTSYYSTLCANCNTVCHDHCGLEMTTNKGESIFAGCACMNGSNCTVCPEKCSYVHHYHDYKTVKIVQVNVDDEIASIKQKYLDAQALLQNTQTKIDDITATRNGMTQEIKNVQIDIKNNCLEIKKICKKYNLTNELYLFIDQLKKDIKNITDINARQNAEDFIKSMTELTQNL